MNRLKIILFFIPWLLLLSCKTKSQQQPDPQIHDLSINISKRYLNLPIAQSEDRSKMIFSVDGKKEIEFVIRLASSKPDYWVFYDVTAYKGKKLKISYYGDPKGLGNIYQDDKINGQDSLYKETNRPQIHFTPRRGWNNDPNGMVYFEGEYHLYFQHNPFEREWQNMSWGHAVSKDLVHWEELPVVMVPDSLGMMFSGTAVVDYLNTSGFGKDGIPPIVVIYTVDTPDNERQCIAYSLDKGRTYIKYQGNPVIDSKAKWNSKDLRDPDVFWYSPANHWVMVLYERDGNSIYTSKNLKDWTYESHVTGFFECPQFFELPVDGNINNRKWVMYGASGTYMTGSFDGRKFTPESGKYYYGNGGIYAAQTFNNIPASDGRRIQIGWGRIVNQGMPFKHLMLLPTELTLRTTKEGIRMYNNPVKEIESLQGKETSWNNLTGSDGSAALQEFNNAVSCRIKTTIKLSHSTDAGLSLYGQPLLRYDMNYNQINGAFYSPEERTGMTLSADIIVDKTCVEVFIDNGAFSYAIERKPVAGNKDGFRFFGNNIEVLELKVYPMKSIWSDKF
jgi:fructan beta-fructosidase